VTKKDLAKIVAQRLDTTQKETLIILDVTLEEIKKSLSEGKRIELRNFGSFKRIKAEPKIARDIRKKKQIPIPDRYRVKFTCGKKLRNMVNLDTR